MTGLANASTLYVGSTQPYKTIQDAVNAAKDGDTIKVQTGVYNENVIIRGKNVILQGVKYPKVYGFETYGGTADISGFSVTKNGIVYHDAGGSNTIRNNKISKIGIRISGTACSGNIIINNLLTNCGISLYDSWGNTITGNKISKATTGIYLGDGAQCKTISNNAISNCGTGIVKGDTTTSIKNNKYSKNKINLK